MQFKVVPFAAKISRNDSTAVVATQMQQIIDDYNSQGWKYLRMDSVQTTVAGSRGCFGIIGVEPPFLTTYTVLVFTKE